jgi:N utilization substance protein B
MSKIPHSQTRRNARMGAVQALYQMDVGGAVSGAVIDEFKEHRFDEGAADEVFFQEIVEGVVAFQDDIDKTISEHLSETWSLKRLDMTLRAIMRTGAFEMMRRPDVPALVVIDEYVSIAAAFFDDKQPAFVNGALEKIAKKVRAAEFGLIGGAVSLPTETHE